MDVIEAETVAALQRQAERKRWRRYLRQNPVPTRSMYVIATEERSLRLHSDLLVKTYGTRRRVQKQHNFISAARRFMHMRYERATDTAAARVWIDGQSGKKAVSGEVGQGAAHADEAAIVSGRHNQVGAVEGSAYLCGVDWEGDIAEQAGFDQENKHLFVIDLFTRISDHRLLHIVHSNRGQNPSTGASYALGPGVTCEIAAGGADF
jgi:hypothetical protein